MLAPLPIRLVLLRPRNPQNLGAAARAMKNFGLSDWAIVDPRTYDFDAARRVAVHAEEILDKPRIAQTWKEAVGDCAWVVGTSSRRVRGKRRLTPSQVAKEALERGSAGTTALVFGDERSGLSNEEIDLCHDLSAIPTAPEQPSLNLSQALVVYGYELHRARLELETRGAPPLPSAATEHELDAIGEAMRRLLKAGGFLHDDERHALRDLLGPLKRARLSRREAKLWIAALRSIGPKTG